MNSTTVLHVIKITPRSMKIARFRLLRMSYFQISVGSFMTLLIVLALALLVL
jgi:hypothetical protein